MSRIRAFLFAPSGRTHRADVVFTKTLLTSLSTAELVESAYRRSGSRQNAFTFAQGVIVGALGNLFASALGHFIDRGGTPFAWPDAAWALIGATSLVVIVSMSVGALRRYAENAQVEQLFISELRRRGVAMSDDSDDPDELQASSNH